MVGELERKRAAAKRRAAQRERARTQRVRKGKPLPESDVALLERTGGAAIDPRTGDVLTEEGVRRSVASRLARESAEETIKKQAAEATRQASREFVTEKQSIFREQEAAGFTFAGERNGQFVFERRVQQPAIRSELRTAERPRQGFAIVERAGEELEQAGIQRRLQKRGYKYYRVYQC